MTKKKILIPIIIVLVLLLGGGVLAMKLSKPKVEPVVEKPKKNRITEPVNIIEVSQRPYVQIQPLADGHNINVIINDVKKDAVDLDYEMPYQTGSMQQGAFGNIMLATLPANEKILLGSCSAGGACTYHENVTGGKLLMRFNGNETYAVESDWKYIINTQGESSFSSKDAKFQITSPDLAKQSYLVIYNTPGYPEGLKGELVSEVYSLTASGTLTGQAELKIRATQEGELSIMGYDGKAWKKFDTTLDPEDNKMAVAKVDLMELYVVVK